MSIYNNHLFICTNVKANNDNCCGVHNAAEMVAYAKRRAKELGLTKETKFRISSSGCMGRCTEGPVLVVYPSGRWYTYKSEADIDNILQSLVEN